MADISWWKKKSCSFDGFIRILMEHSQSSCCFSLNCLSKLPRKTQAWCPVYQLPSCVNTRNYIHRLWLYEDARKLKSVLLVWGDAFEHINKYRYHSYMEKTSMIIQPLNGFWLGILPRKSIYGTRKWPNWKGNHLPNHNFQVRSTLVLGSVCVFLPPKDRWSIYGISTYKSSIKINWM